MDFIYPITISFDMDSGLDSSKPSEGHIPWVRVSVKINSHGFGLEKEENQREKEHPKPTERIRDGGG